MLSVSAIFIVSDTEAVNSAHLNSVEWNRVKVATWIMMYSLATMLASHGPNQNSTTNLANCFWHSCLNVANFLVTEILIVSIIQFFLQN